MSVIIRLQGLPWSASALDIRNFFRGLIIPQGGVHIIGGEKGDAFIAFSSDEDARQGMMRNTACLNGVSVQLFLSSKSEMQMVINEARNRDVSSVAVTPARVMPPTPTSGVGPEFQNQPYPMSHDVSNQQPLQPPNFQKPPDPMQDQFPGIQNANRGDNNQMQNPMHGQAMADRTNQFGQQGERHQDPYQPNAPPGAPKPGNEGQNPWAQGYPNFPSNGSMGQQSQQNQWNTGGYGTGLEGGDAVQDGHQWYEGGGQEYGTKQPYYGGHPPPQGLGQGQQRHPAPSQYDSGAAGREAQFPQHQRRDQPYNAEHFWQEDYGRGSRTTEHPGPQDMNRRNVPPHSGPGGEPPAMPIAARMPPGPGADDHMRFPGGTRPDMEQMPDMMKGQGRGRGHPGDGFGAQTMDEHRFPPGKRERPLGRGGPLRGPFPDGPPKRGILPTPDAASLEQPKEYSTEQFYNPEDVEQSHWPDHTGEEAQGYEHSRGHGHIPPGRNPGARDASTGRERPLDGPEQNRPRNRPRRSRFDQVDEKPAERGPGGRSQERDFGGRPADHYQDERSVERGPGRRPQGEFGLDRGSDGRPHRRGHDGPPHERGHDERPGPERRRPFGGEPDGRPFNRAPGGPSADRDGMAFDGNDHRDPSQRGPDRRPFKRGPDGMPKEGGLLGRAPDRRPFPGDSEQHTGGEHEGRFDLGRSEPGRRFDRPGGRFDGPPGNRFPPGEDFEPMDIEGNPEGHAGPVMRGPVERGFPGARDFDNQGRERGRDRRSEGYRGGRGLNRGDDRGRGRGRRPFGHPGGEFDHHPEDGGYEDRTTEEVHRSSFSQGGDMERGQTFGRGEGRPGRPFRGHGRHDGDRHMPMDRRPMDHGREDVERDRRRELHPDESRGAGKGLLGDAPGGLLPTPGLTRTPENSQSMQNKTDDAERDRDRRGHYTREDRDSGRDERSSRRSDHRQPRDRSPSREHGHRRSDRDRDRSEHRDRSSNRDSKDRGHRGSEKLDKNNQKPDPQMKDMPASKYIHAKGFPVAYTTKEIQRFFFGCDLLFTGIRIVKNAHGQSSGEVYLEFPTEDQAKKAITKNGETIFGTAVIMTFSTKQDFDDNTKMSPPSTEKDQTASNSTPQQDEKGTHIIKIKGLPPNIKREDLINFFSSVKLASGTKSVIIEHDDKKQATGTAYLIVASLKDFETAIGYNGHILGSTALQLSAGDQKEMDACVAKQGDISITVETPNIQQEKPPAGPGVMGARPPLMGLAPPGRTPLLSQKPVNMPHDALRNGPVLDSNKNVPEPLLAERPPRERGPLERPPRERGPMERPPRDWGPMERPPRDWGPMERPPRDWGPMERPPRDWGPMERPPKDWGPMERPPRDWGPMERPPRDLGPMERPPREWGRDRGPGFCVQIQGLPMLATYNEIRDFFSGLKIVSHRGVQIVHDAIGKPTGEAFVEFESQEDKDKALEKDKKSLGSQIVAVKSVAKPDMIDRLRKARLSSVASAQGGPASPHPFGPRRPDGPAPFMTIPPHLLNPRWFYISCQNFPPGITVPEIIDFFQDYSPIPESVRQLYSDDGMSTGNAVVAFFNRDDAEMALQDLNGMLVGQSMVVLQPIKSSG